MRALLLLSLALFLAGGPILAQGRELPVCPSCDCWDQDCMVRPCHCGDPLDDAAAASLLDYAGSMLRHSLGDGMSLDPPVQVKVVGPEDLRLEDGVVALGTYRDGVIRLGRWLRRSEALMVLAHEYGHAWQDRTNPRAVKLSERFSEGFASWVAQVVARRTGYLAEAGRIRDRSGSDYREGARLFSEWEQVHGVETVLRLAREWTDFAGEGPVEPLRAP